MSHSKAQKMIKQTVETRSDGTRLVTLTIDEIPVDDNGVIRGRRLKYPLEDYLDIDSLDYVDKDARIVRENIRMMVLKYFQKTGTRPIIRMSKETLRFLLSSSEIIQYFIAKNYSDCHGNLAGYFTGMDVYESDNIPDGVIYVGSGMGVDAYANYIYLSKVWGGSGGYRIDVQPAAVHEEVQESEV